MDDLLVYMRDEEKYILVVNASNIEKDYKYMRDNNKYGAALCDLSEDMAQIALQGPKSKEILENITADIPEKYYTFIETNIYSNYCFISKTGYTGEDGYEIYCPEDIAEILWEDLIQAGGDDIIPCGLGARDTLRFEASMPLYGHELTPDITPIEAGLKYFVKIDKGNDFIGKSVLESQIKDGVTAEDAALR